MGDESCNCFIDAWKCPKCGANYPDVEHTPLSQGGFDWTDGDGIAMSFHCKKCDHDYRPVFLAAFHMEDL